jgi:phospholipid/cholesterol/gamma-HCH transport system substrate-binding protein
VTFRIDEGVKLQTDAIVSIKTKGLIGEKFVQVSPGGSDKLVPAGGQLREVEAPVDLEELISKYVFGKV